MITNVEQAMLDYGDTGYDCFEIPAFIDDEPLIVAYKPDYLRDDSVMLAIMHMPDLFNNDDTTAYWEGGMARVEAYELALQGHDAKYIDVYVMGLTDWMCVLQGVAISEGTRKFSYADMFDVIKMELSDMGLI